MTSIPPLYFSQLINYCTIIWLQYIQIEVFMGKEIPKILHPKAHGLKARQKPIALIINSPYDKPESSTRLEPKKNILLGQGFGVLNKGMVFFDTPKEELKELIKPTLQHKGDLTLYTNAHGAPGWFLGGDKSPLGEMQGLYQFAELVRNIEEKTGQEVKNIVLGGCYNAVEMYNEDTGCYFNSPARLLSMIFPEKKIVGFIGEFADGKITHVYTKDHEPMSVNPENSSILFQDGRMVESPTRSLYCSHKYTPDFICTKLSLGEVGKNDYFVPFCFKEAF